MPSGFVDQREIKLNEGDKVLVTGVSGEGEITKINVIPEAHPQCPQGVVTMEVTLKVKVNAPYPGGMAPFYKLASKDEPKSGPSLVKGN